ncbi:MAG: hypothetical protein ACTMIR_13120 [Cellulomonadaceae bacterium]
MTQSFPPPGAPDPQRVPAGDPRSDFVPGPQESGYDPKLTLEPGRFIAGAAATALVAALVGMVGVVVFERIFSFRLVPPPDVLSSGSHQTAFAVGGALLAILAAVVLAVLVLAAPRPRLFFGWIMGLVTTVITVLPFAWTSTLTSAAFTGVVNLLIGVAVWTLLAGVASRTIKPSAG